MTHLPGETPQVLLATGAEWPDLWLDDRPLLDALRGLGVDAAPAVWSSSSVRWAEADLVVVRSVFDYVDHREDFLGWADRVERLTRLENPARVLRWNSHKRYLSDLEQHGVPVVPTAWVEARERTTLAEVLSRRGWNDVVVKPAVANGARGALRVRPADREAGEQHLRALAAGGDVLVQPFLEEFLLDGERSLVFVDGRFSHAVRKEPALADPSWTPWSVAPAVVERDLVGVAERACAAAGEALLYGRVDVIEIDGVPTVTELELLDPLLFIEETDGAADAIAAAIAGRLR